MPCERGDIGSVCHQLYPLAIMPALTTTQQRLSAGYQKIATRLPNPTYASIKRMADLRQVSMAYLITEYCDRGLGDDSKRLDELISDL